MNIVLRDHIVVGRPDPDCEDCYGTGMRMPKGLMWLIGSTKKVECECIQSVCESTPYVPK